MQPYWYLEILGEIRLTSDQRVVTRFSTQKVAALLTYLATCMPASVPRERLIEMFWPDQETESGRNSLSVALSSLRRQLMLPGTRVDAVLEADRFCVRLNPLTISTDVAEFERHLQTASADTPNRREYLRKAVDLFRGDFAQGFYYDWAIREQVRLQYLYSEALFQLLADLEQAGDYSDALSIAYKAVDADSLSERAHCALIRLLVATGRTTLALETASTLERRHKEEFGAELSSETGHFLARLRRDPASVVVSSSGEIVTGAPLPAISSSHADPRSSKHPVAAQESTTKGEARAATNLPLRLTQMFGRTKEIEQIVEMLCPLQGDGFRLVTLTGPGGTGKTRLSQAVGGVLVKRQQGHVCFVSLAELKEPTEIPTAILSSLNIRAATDTEPLPQVIDHLRLHPTLLILDNLEQLLWDDLLPGPELKRRDAAHIVYRLLDQVPTLICLCTSRRRLRIEGEREFRVAALPVSAGNATVEQMARVPGIQLYVDRAQAARADFQLTPGNAASVSELCSRLEGIPLAIELAAAWVRTLPPRAMLERTKNRLALPQARYADVPVRHRSLTAVFDWSYALLTPQQQRFFTRVGLFIGGWTIEAAMKVGDEAEALELTEGLLGASLAYESQDGLDPRFRLLETVRDYSLQKLAENGEVQQASARFRRYYEELACRAETRLEGPEQKEWLDLIGEEYTNICSVLDADLANPEGGEAALRITAAIWRYWFIRGRLREGNTRFTAALKHPNASNHPRLRMTALLRRGNLLSHLNRYADADADYLEVFQLAEQIDDAESKIAVIVNRAILKSYQGDFEPATQLGKQALNMSREIGSQRLEGSSLGTLGIIAQKIQDWPTARAYIEACIALNREIGNRHLVAVNLLNLASIATDEGDAESAHLCLRECLEVCGEIDARKLLIDALLFLIVRLIEAQQWVPAARLCGVATGLQERLDFIPQPTNRKKLSEVSIRARDALDNEVFVTEFNAGHSLSPEEAVGFALTCL